ncbi:MAG: GHKL domain-containing protein [Lachnospiraceae bacterium]|nr:GHKL domain-containing protein [Lachnospiraceae bacterium]
MSRYGDLQKQYEELDRRYAELYAKHSELEYEYGRLREDTAEREQQDQEIRALHQNVRKLKHDMKNHFMVLSSYLASENYDAARAYSSEILEKLNSMHSYVETGNTLMNHIVNEKLQFAREQGILLKAEIENLSFARMSGMDFTALFGNLLDNAIEASLREETGKREMVLLVSERQGYEVVCVKNRISSSVLERNPDLATTKENGGQTHGIGICRVREIAEKYGGMYDIYETDGYFCFAVFIPK